MEVKIKFLSGMVESHRLPEFAGNTVSLFDERAGTEQGFNDIDSIVDVVERIELEETGFVLSRYAIGQEGGKLERRRSSRYCVLPKSRMGEAERVLVDDELMWENPACVDSVEVDSGIGW